MYYHCDHCGFEKLYAPTGVETCPVCDIGTLREGRGTWGFKFGDRRPVLRHVPKPAPYAPCDSKSVDTPGKFSYFASETGKAYQAFVQKHTIYIGRFTKLEVPEPEAFAWLTPYTGNKHNRTHFTQRVLATVAQAKFIENGGRFPRLIEPFVGSGQIFLHASRWGPSLTGGLPLFHQVIAGDTNGYLIAAYHAFATGRMQAVKEYVSLATAWDKHRVSNHREFVAYLDLHGAQAVANSTSAQAKDAAFKYIWLVNRCVRGTKINKFGGITAKRAVMKPGRIGTIRTRERLTLTALCEVLGRLRFTVTRQDFAQTCAQANRADIVYMDCPFPSPTTRIPDPSDEHPENFGTRAANTYGNDGEETLQTRIVDTARRLAKQGTTVILCNFANPGLIQAYTRLVAEVVGGTSLRHFTYAYRSPSTTTEAYLLTIVPGADALHVPLVPEMIREQWLEAGGDNNFDSDPGKQEFFAATEEVAMDSKDEEQDEAEDAEEEEAEDEEIVEDDDEDYVPEQDGAMEYERYS
jgi:site-specific DNA-adenine methylase